MYRSFTINDMPTSEKPRERLKRLGPEALSNIELLCIMLGKGVKGESVFIVSQRLLSRFKSLKAIGEASVCELVQIRGIGLAKASQIQAMFELSRRSEEVEENRTVIYNHCDVFRLMRPRLKDKTQELFMIISLDSRHRVKAVTPITVGTLDASPVHPREVFKAAIQNLASSVILIHNHPSGNSDPSQADIDVTRKMVEAGKIIGIRVLDHVIVTRSDAYSFADNGLM